MPVSTRPNVLKVSTRPVAKDSASGLAKEIAAIRASASVFCFMVERHHNLVMDHALDAAEMAVPGLAVHVLERCTSTNTRLLDGEYEPPCLLAAEEQTAGRGRRGRRWYAARGMSATFSVAHLSRRPLRELTGLSLVAGVAAAQALGELGANEARLKWPNDLVVGAHKLGGVLVETRPPSDESQAARWRLSASASTAGRTHSSRA